MIQHEKRIQGLQFTPENQFPNKRIQKMINNHKTKIQENKNPRTRIGINQYPEGKKINDT